MLQMKNRSATDNFFSLYLRALFLYSNIIARKIIEIYNDLLLIEILVKKKVGSDRSVRND